MTEWVGCERWNSVPWLDTVAEQALIEGHVAPKTAG
jgi:hypothetical protein